VTLRQHSVEGGVKLDRLSRLISDVP